MLRCVQHVQHGPLGCKGDKSKAFVIAKGVFRQVNIQDLAILLEVVVQTRGQKTATLEIDTMSTTRHFAEDARQILCCIGDMQYRVCTTDRFGVAHVIFKLGSRRATQRHATHPARTLHWRSTDAQNPPFVATPIVRPSMRADHEC